MICETRGGGTPSSSIMAKNASSLGYGIMPSTTRLARGEGGKVECASHLCPETAFQLHRLAAVQFAVEPCRAVMAGQRIEVAAGQCGDAHRRLFGGTGLVCGHALQMVGMDRPAAVRLTYGNVALAAQRLEPADLRLGELVGRRMVMPEGQIDRVAAADGGSDLGDSDVDLPHAPAVVSGALSSR